MTTYAERHPTTKKQFGVLEAILEIQASGEIATIRAIQRKVGLNSTSTVHDHLKKLKRKGLIKIINFQGKPAPLVVQGPCPTCGKEFDALQTERTDP